MKLVSFFFLVFNSCINNHSCQSSEHLCLHQTFDERMDDVSVKERGRVDETDDGRLSNLAGIETESLQSNPYLRLGYGHSRIILEQNTMVTNECNQGSGEITIE